MATPSSSSSHHSLSRERNGEPSSQHQQQQQQQQPLLQSTSSQPRKHHHHHSLEREKILRTNQLQQQQQHMQQTSQMPHHPSAARQHHQHHQHHHSLDRSNSGGNGGPAGHRLDDPNAPGMSSDQFETQSNRSFYHNASASRSNKSIHSMQEQQQQQHQLHHSHHHPQQQPPPQQMMGGGHPQGYKNFSLPRKSIDSGLEYGMDGMGAMDLQGGMATSSPGYPGGGGGGGGRELKATHRPPKDPHRHHHHHHHHGSGRSRTRIDAAIGGVGSSISSLPGSDSPIGLGPTDAIDRQTQLIPKNSTQSLAAGGNPVPLGTRKPSHSGSILSVASNASEQCGVNGSSSFQPGFSSPSPTVQSVGNGITAGVGRDAASPALMQTSYHEG
ncbi:hypothetical protein ZHAS_00018904 [Anopheles sinensis]|uniref:Uncharacterized protein n=1 Tax=Anopheles sinensis TaxID=74873 RepID=A0A084WK43_ANOSI|nr:hypothetical protein ZHAS_00018904 [Anopheles sinensis]